MAEKIRLLNSTLSRDPGKPLKRKTPLRARSAPKRSTPLKPSQPKRDWSDALLKKEKEAVCRNCGSDFARHPGRRLECAHTVGREYDQPKPCALCNGEGILENRDVALFVGRDLYAPCPLCDGEGTLTPGVLWVNPDDTVPLCGPATDSATCHGRQERHELDIQTLLTPAEQLRVVLHEGTIELARRRVAPTAYTGRLLT
jgi:hypothetical protein